MATKKTSSSGTGSRSRSKKAATTPETNVPTENTVTGNTATSSPATGNTGSTITNPNTVAKPSFGGAAVAPAREKTVATTPSPATAKPNFNYPSATQDKIRQRAYELFVKRGGQHGFDIQDWLQAEAEFTKR